MIIVNRTSIPTKTLEALMEAVLVQVGVPDLNTVVTFSLGSGLRGYARRRKKVIIPARLKGLKGRGGCVVDVVGGTINITVPNYKFDEPEVAAYRVWKLLLHESAHLKDYQTGVTDFSVNDNLPKVEVRSPSGYVVGYRRGRRPNWGNRPEEKYAIAETNRVVKEGWVETIIDELGAFAAGWMDALILRRQKQLVEMGYKVIR